MNYPTIFSGWVVHMIKNIQNCYSIKDLQLQKMHHYQRPAKRRFFRFLNIYEVNRIKKTYINGIGFTDYNEKINNKKYQEEYNELENTD